MRTPAVAMTILLIAYHFPPDTSIGGARPYRFRKYLERLGYRVVVVTASPGATGDVLHAVDPLREKPRAGLAFLAERLGWKFFLRAELRLAWSQAAWRVGRKFLDGHRGPVTILSTAPPVATHLAAWRLARYSGHSWVADFRDPLYSPDGEKATLPWAGPQLERFLLGRAQFVLANTDAMASLWRARYPELSNKIHTLWNGYDPEDLIPLQPAPGGPCRTVSHVGELYGGRDLKPVVYSLGRLLERGLLAPGSVRIRQVGQTEAAEVPPPDFLRLAQAGGWLQIQPRVTPPEARAIALGSDGLLLVQPHSAIQVPGKLFEYLRMGRPILAYIVRDSPVARILENAGVPFESIYPGDTPEAMDAAVLRFMARLDGAAHAPAPWFEENFEASRQAATLARLLETA